MVKQWWAPRRPQSALEMENVTVQRQPAQQARGRATRGEILDTAAALFAEKGYSQTSIQDILDRTGLKKGGLYYHFKTKQQIAVAVVTEGFAMDDTPPVVGPLQAVVDASITLAWLTPQVPVVKAAARLATDQDHEETFGYLWSQYIPRVTQLLEEAKRLEELQPGVRPDQTSFVWVAAYTGVDLMCRRDYAALPWKIAEMNAHFVSGIATPTALAGLDMRAERGRELLQTSPWAAEYLSAVLPHSPEILAWQEASGG
ncbi:TetR/AcrR family transcriptional regulator [Streptomyces sp. Ru62]|uniref:TetR/AcrR family transcriptional regulator n=1 Tax=Streptomyces sp. Ru62 TaxID=2080745 RepID=UPI00215641C7|nr:TetR/AcrR family transcriptional regulator [Streptomyces sp. Ru62]